MRAPALAAFLASALAAACQEPSSPKAASEAPAADDVPATLPRVPIPDDLGARALKRVEAVVRLGPRHPGSPGWEKALAYIAGEIRALGLEPVRDRWQDPSEKITFENVHVTLPGKVRDRIVLGCHHDTKVTHGHADPDHNFEFVGANDSGSGIGLLLELIRVLATRERQATYQFVFFDGEESLDWTWNEGKRALFGSRRFVRQHRELALSRSGAPRIAAFVLLDMVGAKDLSIDDDTNSDPEFKKLFLAAARTLGHERYFFKNRLAVSDDHLPFLDAGIRSIDLIDLADNPQWHTPQDTLEHLSAESLQIVGAVVLTALPELERRLLPKPGTLVLPHKEGGGK
ncbi:MAG: M28 family peptidase [Planctomycetes bacterium]|nr:M28 family peptidase [Planctomycetota bacterium]